MSRCDRDIQVYKHDVTKRGVKGVKYVLTCQLWLQIYVSIVNRDAGSYYPLRNTRITYDLVLIFPRLFDLCKCGILVWLCYDGSLHELIKIHDRFEWSHKDVRSVDNRAFGCACAFGHLEVAKWLYETFQLNVTASCSKEIFSNACGRGQLDVAKWLYTVFHYSVDDVRSNDNDIFSSPLDNRHEDVCDWLVATFGESVICSDMDSDSG